MNEASVTVDPASGSLVLRYEILRSGALGQPIAPEHRSGLVVLLRHGMWAWVRAIADEGRPPQAPHHHTSTAGRTPGTLVHLLADLAIAPAGRMS